MFLFSANSFCLKASGVYAKDIWIRAGILSEVRQQERHSICKISSVDLYSELKACILPPLKRNDDGSKMNKHQSRTTFTYFQCKHAIQFAILKYLYKNIFVFQLFHIDKRLQEFTRGASRLGLISRLRQWVGHVVCKISYLFSFTSRA